MKRLTHFGLLSVFATAWLPCAAQSRPEDSAREHSKGHSMLELVFVIDTTGSMSGLIEGAKQKVWSIVNDVMKSQSRPAVRVGLVAFRDKGDAYVTKVLPLSADLDKVYSTLMEYRADGGGDTPENVRRALAEGVKSVGWSQRSEKTAQILFLVGDAPPHEDYQEEPSCRVTTSTAVKAGIVVNTIQCGSIEGTQEIWQEIARLGEGQYFSIAQDGGVQTIATPYDRDLSKLGAKIGSTYLAYGGGGGGGGRAGGRAYRAKLSAGQASIEGKVAASAPMAAQADRALNKAINSSAYANDLLTEVESGRVKLKDVKDEDLPDHYQKLSLAERQKAVDVSLAERKKVRQQILELSKKRDIYIAEQRRRQTSTKPGSFDAAVSNALKKEAAKKGIVW